MTTTAPATTTRDGLLRFALRLDAVVSGATGAGLTLAAGGLDSLLGLPAVALVVLGVGFVGYGVLIWRLAAPATVNAGAARVVVAGNVGWAVLSVVALLADWLSLTTVGVALAVTVAACTTVFADLQFLGLRRLTR